jgi:drug/metabolite transporter (DMT)-like permease
MPNSQKPPLIPPKIAVVFGILAVSVASILIRWTQDQVSSIVIAAYRLGISTLVLAPIAVIRHRAALRGLSRRELGLGLLSGVFLALHFATWITSLEYTSVASSVVLVTTTPLWVALLSPLTLRETISRTVAIGLLLALVGTVVIGLGDVCVLSNRLVCPPFSTFIAGEAFLGDLLALVGAFAAAGYVLIGRSLRAKLSLVPYVSLVYGAAAVILVGMAAASGNPMAGFSGEIFLLLALLALVPQLLGHSTFNWALGYLPAAYVAVTLLGEPIGSTILAYLILGEVPGKITLFGAILVFGGILIASRPESKRSIQMDLTED